MEQLLVYSQRLWWRGEGLGVRLLYGICSKACVSEATVDI